MRFHPPSKCKGRPCPIHNPSEHSMRDMPIFVRETGLIERTCPHGIGHPDPDSLAYFRSIGREGFEVHGCDGCCVKGTPVTQASLFDYPAARREAQSGMARALDHASPNWKERVRAAIAQLAATGRPFISDDVRRIAGDPPPGTHYNTMGALLYGAASRKLIVPAGDAKSARVGGHGNAVKQWVGA